MAKVFLKARRARPIWFGHPWVFSGAIERVRGQLRDGDVVDVLDHEGREIGQGFWNSKSQIQVRVVALKPEGPLSAELLQRRLDRALDLRERTLRLTGVTNAYRLVHGEGDGLPGLVVDRLDQWLVVQVSALGLVPFLDGLLSRLEERYRPMGVLERVSSVALEEEGLERPGGVIRGEAPAGPVTVLENGVTYLCDGVGGQKTGWYSDQRDNRRTVASWAEGLEVWDTFSYVGGFGLAAAKAGARLVRCIDSSGPALDLLRVAAAQQGWGDRVQAEEGNVLRILDHDAKEGREADLVILDPPKFVRNRSTLQRGLRLYHEVNLKGARVLRDGGLLVTCSCSQHVSGEDFDEMLGSVAHEGGFRFQEVFRGGQGPDHPILHPHDESRYLKIRALRVLKGPAS